MNNTNYSTYRNQCVPSRAGRPMPPTACYRPSAPQSPRGGYGSGFCDGFCDGADKVLDITMKMLTFTSFLR